MKTAEYLVFKTTSNIPGSLSSANEQVKTNKIKTCYIFIFIEKETHSCQIIDYALLLQDLKLEKGYFLVIVCLVQIIQRLQLLQWWMGADLLLLRTRSTERKMF